MTEMPVPSEEPGEAPEIDRRTYFAAACLQGLLTHHGTREGPYEMAQAAVRYADALCDRLGSAPPSSLP